MQGHAYPNAAGGLTTAGGLIVIALLDGTLLGRLGELPVRIDDEFVCDTGVEVFVAFRRLLLDCGRSESRCSELQRSRV
jgi:hypothetical protein